MRGASRRLHRLGRDEYRRRHAVECGTNGSNAARVNEWLYIDAALDQLKDQGYPVLEEDVARLSPFARRHINVNGTNSLSRPDLGPTGVRALRDTDQPDWDEDQS
ncbi:Tn3 family transposase [Actinomadura rifamycini]|uniref:Tn3 family transposase n=1 Tax=Actinomadura rifamycini TaxID=31962 RepID=UPI0004253A93|nr:Tn3 family transposase [Actinomadura rifamycini]